MLTRSSRVQELYYHTFYQNASLFLKNFKNILKALKYAFNLGVALGCQRIFRPSKARESVTSSAYSKSLPTGIPYAKRVTLIPIDLTKREI